MRMIDQNFLPVDHARIDHGFFTRKNGVSKGLYNSLNCGAGSNDIPSDVQQNRVLVAEEMGVDKDNLCTVYQIHSAECITLKAPLLQQKPECDAMVTDQPNLLLGILTADCTPVLLYGQKEGGAPVIGAAHAGWGGAVNGVLQNTVNAMINLGALPKTIRASIGPCIAQKSYEVGQEFYDRFCQQGAENDRFFKSAQKQGHAMFDLPGYCAHRLAMAGVRHISLVDKDTYSMTEDFFSYRRATHNGEADYGRQISCIAIKS